MNCYNCRKCAEASTQGLADQKVGAKVFFPASSPCVLGKSFALDLAGTSIASEAVWNGTFAGFRLRHKRLLRNPATIKGRPIAAVSK
jgi:hypothetical protein